ncbi:hypothetical protein BGZ89_008578 [Linnemannia elongata]|nr:hypothetical protein BGZ89_008578 [Linnemannia elongata]
MGVIDLVCVTTDPGATTYYGLAYADDYGQGSKRINYAVLIKSNTKPISPGDLTWSVVSMFDSSKLAGDPYSVTAADCSCVINEQGVFTMFGLSAGAMSTTASTFPFGIRYDPTSGAWMNVTVNAGYTWSGVFSRRSLGYVNNEALAIGNDQLYALGQDRTVLLHDYEYAADPGTLTTFPLSTLSLSTPASKGRLQDTSLKCNTFPTQVLYIIGDSPITTGWILPIKDYKNSSALSILEWFYVNITSMDYFVPIGNYTGSSTIGLFKKEDTMYTFGNDNGSWYTHLVDDVNITNSLGVDPNPPLASPSSPLLSTGAIVGIVVGVVVVLAGTVFLLLRMIRKSKNKVNITTAAVVKDDSATAEDGDKNASFRNLPESTYLGYSSAPAYSNVIAQPSSQDSPEVAPQEFVESSETVASLPVPSSAVGSGFHSMQS